MNIRGHLVGEVMVQNLRISRNKHAFLRDFCNKKAIFNQFCNKHAMFTSKLQDYFTTTLFLDCQHLVNYHYNQLIYQNMRFSEHRRKCGNYVDFNPGLPPFFERLEVVFNLAV